MKDVGDDAHFQLTRATQSVHVSSLLPRYQGEAATSKFLSRKFLFKGKFT